jgi:hypothetical protein
MALLYLVKKLQLSSWIVRRVLLFLEYKFLVVYKPGCSHSMADALSQLLDVTKNLTMPNIIIGASLFVLQPEWL